MFTGRHAHELNCNYGVPLNRQYLTMAEALTRRGYATAGFVGNTALCSRHWGLSRGFLHYEDMYSDPERLLMSSNLTRTIMNHKGLRRLTASNDLYARPYAPTINQRLVRWLDSNRHHPFFAFVNYFEAHAPYCPPPPFDSKFGPKRPRSIPPFIFRPECEKVHIKYWLTDEALQVEFDAYDGAIAFLDDEIGSLLGASRNVASWKRRSSSWLGITGRNSPSTALWDIAIPSTCRHCMCR